MEEIKRKTIKGQIAIITLFALSVFVVIGSSVVTQIVFEQKKATLEQKSREAYFAAESGIEKALQEILINNVANYNSPAGGLEVGDASVEVTTASSAGGATYLVPSELFPGDSFFLNLEGYGATTDELYVCWDKPDSGLIVTYFYTNAGISLTNTVALNAANATPDYPITGAFSGSSVVNGCGMNGSVNRYTLPTVGTPDYLVVWAAYADAIRVGFQGVNGNNIPSQGTIITSTANVAENNDLVTREVKYFVSSVGGSDLVYPPDFLTVPVYAVGGVTY